MCGGVASRLGKKVFDDLLQEWLGELKPAKFVTFMCGGVASRLGKKLFDDWLKYWLGKLKPKVLTMNTEGCPLLLA